MWKGFSVQLWKPWKEQQEAEDGRKRRSWGQRTSWTAPGGYIRKTLTNTAMGARKSDGVVRTQADQSGDFELTQHEADQTESAVQGDEAPQATNLAPADEVALSLGTPQQQQGVTMLSAGVETATVKKLAPSR